jgi:hypothetical protein
MFRYGDKKKIISGTAHWFSQNPDARITSYKAGLSHEWDRVSSLVQDEHAGISLIWPSLFTMGIAMPPSLIYVHHLKVRDDRDYYPVEHVEIDTIRKAPDFNGLRLNGGKTLVLLDDGKPIVALGSYLFRNCELAITNSDGRVDFNRYRHKEYYPDQHWLIDPRDIDPEEAVRQLFGSAVIPDLPPVDFKPVKFEMNEKDDQILDGVLARLRDVRINLPENYSRVVENLRIDMATGTVRDITDLQPADKPTNET